MKKNENIEGITYLEPFSKQDVKKFSPLTTEEIDKVLKSINDSLKIMNENSLIPIGKIGVTDLTKGK